MENRTFLLKVLAGMPDGFTHEVKARIADVALGRSALDTLGDDELYAICFTAGNLIFQGKLSRSEVPKGFLPVVEKCVAGLAWGRKR